MGKKLVKKRVEAQAREQVEETKKSFGQMLWASISKRATQLGLLLYMFFSHKLYVLLLAFSATNPIAAALIGGVLVMVFAAIVVSSIRKYVLPLLFAHNISDLMMEEYRDSLTEKGKGLFIGLDSDNQIRRSCEEKIKKDLNTLFEKRKATTGIEVDVLTDLSSKDRDDRVETAMGFLKTINAVWEKIGHVATDQEKQDMAKLRQCFIGNDGQVRVKQNIGDLFTDVYPKDVKPLDDELLIELFDEIGDYNTEKKRQKMEICATEAGEDTLDFDGTYSPQQLLSLTKIAINQARACHMLNDGLVDPLLASEDDKKSAFLGDISDAVALIEVLAPSNNISERGKEIRGQNLCQFFLGSKAKRNLSLDSLRELYIVLNHAFDDELSQNIETSEDFSDKTKLMRLLGSLEIADMPLEKAVHVVSLTTDLVEMKHFSQEKQKPLQAKELPVRRDDSGYSPSPTFENQPLLSEEEDNKNNFRL